MRTFEVGLLGTFENFFGLLATPLLDTFWYPTYTFGYFWGPHFDPTFGLFKVLKSSQKYSKIFMFSERFALVRTKIGRVEHLSSANAKTMKTHFGSRLEAAGHLSPGGRGCAPRGCAVGRRDDSAARAAPSTPLSGVAVSPDGADSQWGSSL